MGSENPSLKRKYPEILRTPGQLPIKKNRTVNRAYAPDEGSSALSGRYFTAHSSKDLVENYHNSGLGIYSAAVMKNIVPFGPRHMIELRFPTEEDFLKILTSKQKKDEQFSVEKTQMLEKVDAPTWGARLATSGFESGDVHKVSKKYEKVSSSSWTAPRPNSNNIYFDIYSSTSLEIMEKISPSAEIIKIHGVISDDIMQAIPEHINEVLILDNVDTATISRIPEHIRRVCFVKEIFSTQIDFIRALHENVNCLKFYEVPDLEILRNIPTRVTQLVFSVKDYTSEKCTLEKKELYIPESVKILCFNQSLFPKNLKSIPNTVEKLFVWGDLMDVVKKESILPKCEIFSYPEKSDLYKYNEKNPSSLFEKYEKTVF